MIFRALACDYDGTLATSDRISESTAGALRRARQAGLKLVLVTGRVFFELIRVCEHLDLFDVVVAENGGVLHLPGSGSVHSLAPAPTPALINELERRAVAFRVGHVVVDMTRDCAEAARQALAAAGAHMDLVFNRGFLMLVPPGVSKGAGVQSAIRLLDLTSHDVLAIGDAENDLDFLEACDWRACPENALAEVKQRADWVFAGENGASVAWAIDERILPGVLPVADSPRHQLRIGWATGSGEPVTIPERDVNLLIQGDPVSGKSWLAGLLAERLVERRYGACVIDPEGDYSSLACLPGVSAHDISDRGALESALQRFEHDPCAFAVLDLSTLHHAEKVHVIEAALTRIHQLRRHRATPHWVILDEAHYSLHSTGVAEAAATLEERGFCLVTCRMSWVRESVLEAMDMAILTRTTTDDELEVFRARLAAAGLDPAVAALLPELPQGQGLMLTTKTATGPSVLTFTVARRETPHVRHLRKYAESRLEPDQHFLFRSPDGRLIATADSLQAFRKALSVVPLDSVAFHAGRRDFSRWIHDVSQDRVLARQMRMIEARWKRGDVHRLRDALARPLAAAMAGLG